MMWRASRPTVVRENVSLPYEGADGILVGARDLSVLRDLAIWRRLIATGLPNVPLFTLLIADTWTPKLRRTAGAAFSPSELSRISFVNDSDGLWAALTEGEALFVALVREGRGPLLILGAPTDEAWDRLEEAVNNLRSEL